MACENCEYNIVQVYLGFFVTSVNISFLMAFKKLKKNQKIKTSQNKSTSLKIF